MPAGTTADIVQRAAAETRYGIPSGIPMLVRHQSGSTMHGTCITPMGIDDGIRVGGLLDIGMGMGGLTTPTLTKARFAQRSRSSSAPGSTPPVSPVPVPPRLRLRKTTSASTTTATGGSGGSAGCASGSDGAADTERDSLSGLGDDGGSISLGKSGRNMFIGF